MAIKIKKKSEEVLHSPEIVDEPEVEVVSPYGDISGVDFRKQSHGNWVEDNPQKAVGIVVGLVVAVLGVHFGMEIMESQKVSASADLAPAYSSYSGIVKGSTDFEAIEKSEELPTPNVVFETEKAKWEAVYSAAKDSLTKHGGTDLGRASRMTMAAAAMRLGNVDEAIALYDEALPKAANDAEKLTIQRGLASAHSAKGEFDKALEAIAAIEAMDALLPASVRYEKARLLEKSGKVDEAKNIYHAILDEEPMHPQKSDIERRLATL